MFNSLGFLKEDSLAPVLKLQPYYKESIEIAPA